MLVVGIICAYHYRSVEKRWVATKRTINLQREDQHHEISFSGNVRRKLCVVRLGARRGSWRQPRYKILRFSHLYFSTIFVKQFKCKNASPSV
jgi:hypothetical protein